MTQLSEGKGGVIENLFFGLGKGVLPVILFAPLLIMATGFFKKLFANLALANMGKFGFLKSNYALMTSAVPFLLDFNLFRNIMKDISEGNYLKAITGNFGSLLSLSILLLNPFGRLIVILKFLYETIKEMPSFIDKHVMGDSSLFDLFDRDTLGENSVKFLNKKYGLPEDASKNSYLFREKYREDFAKDIEIANAKQDRLAKSISQATKEGVIEGIKEAGPDYSKTGKVETNITNNNTKTYPYTSANPYASANFLNFLGI